MGGDTEKELLKIVEGAIKQENASESIYRRAAELAHQPEVKDMFDRLADEEQKHEAQLREVYRDIKKRLGLKILAEDE